jgi:hypothetical protein
MDEDGGHFRRSTWCTASRSEMARQGGGPRRQEHWPKASRAHLLTLQVCKGIQIKGDRRIFLVQIGKSWFPYMHSRSKSHLLSLSGKRKEGRDRWFRLRRQIIRGLSAVWGTAGRSGDSGRATRRRPRRRGEFLASTFMQWYVSEIGED